MAALGWQQGVLGVMLPVLVAALTAPAPLPALQLHAAPPAGTQEAQHGQPRALCSQQHHAGDKPAAARAAGYAMCAVHAALGLLGRLDAALQVGCRCAADSALQAASLGGACLLLAANLWMLARGAALRAAAVAGKVATSSLSAGS